MVRWKAAQWFNATAFGLISLMSLSQLVQPDSLAGHLFTLALFSFPSIICFRALRAEVSANGTTTEKRGQGYGQETYWIITCLNSANAIDLTVAGCLLPSA